MNRFFTSLFCVGTYIFLTPPLASAATIAWSVVGNPGNAPDTTTGSLYGAVPYVYRIGTYDVTASQYAEFLNAKDATGANSLGLYNNGMSDATYGGISFNAGSVNGSKYGVISGRGNHPANSVTWYDTVRFANWLNNGQGDGDTEGGAYTLLGGTPTPSNALSIVRNAAAAVFLPSEDEWYKAAFYNAATDSYFQYPTGSNLQPNAVGPIAAPNSANYNFAVGNLTDVGAYSGTTSPYGAFDMGGNVFQWNEALIDGSNRGFRGGPFNYNEGNMLSSARFSQDLSAGGSILLIYGFRVASVPEPSTLALAAFGALSLLTAVRRKR